MSRVPNAALAGLLTGYLAMTTSSAGMAAALVQPVPAVTLAGARVALDAARASAERLGAPSSIAVVDRAGVLVAFESLDGVRPASPELAIGKARAAAVLQRPTIEIENNTNQGRTAFVTTDFLALRGGVPLRDGEVVVGAIGVAGTNKDNDVRISDEAAAGFAQQAGGAQQAGAQQPAGRWVATRP